MTETYAPSDLTDRDDDTLKTCPADPVLSSIPSCFIRPLTRARSCVEVARTKCCWFVPGWSSTSMSYFAPSTNMAAVHVGAWPLKQKAETPTTIKVKRPIFHQCLRTTCNRSESDMPMSPVSWHDDFISTALPVTLRNSFYSACITLCAGILCNLLRLPSRSAKGYRITHDTRPQ